MGYCTYFTLTVDNVSNELAEALEREIETRFDFLESAAEGEWQNEVTWYNWKDDMTQLSKDFPSALFELHGEGDDREDMWTAYFQNGKVQVHEARIEYDAFDPAWGEEASATDRRLTGRLIAASRVNPDERYCDDTTIYRNDMGGYSSCIFQKGITSVQTIPADMFSWNHDDNLEEYLTLREVWEQAQKFLGRHCPVLYVWVESQDCV